MDGMGDVINSRKHVSCKIPTPVTTAKSPPGVIIGLAGDQVAIRTQEITCELRPVEG